MRKTFLDNLPRYRIRAQRKNGEIDWKNCIGFSIKFIYDEIEGELNIINVIMEKGKRYIITEYGNHKNFHISTSGVLDCKLGGLLGTHTKKYKYDIGDIIDSTKSGKLEVLEQINISNEKNTRLEKGYRYKCLICGNIDTISESNLKTNQGCNVCCNPSKKILKGYNDLWTTHPNVAKMLKYPEIGYAQTFGSAIKQIYICPDCGYEKNTWSHLIISQGFCCPKCSDNVSYPEKFMFSLLEQLNLEFEPQLSKTTFKWCKNYRYDFYIHSLNYIIETNGIQHYEKDFEKIKSKTKKIKTLIEEQENDRLKQKLALENAIDKYIAIDCRYSNFKFVKNSILNSDLSLLFDLSNIDWLKCHEYACNSLVKVACDLWNNGMKNTLKIANSLKLVRATIITYLKRGKVIGWCNYHPYAKM